MVCIFDGRCGVLNHDLTTRMSFARGSLGKSLVQDTKFFLVSYFAYFAFLCFLLFPFWEPGPNRILQVPPQNKYSFKRLYQSPGHRTYKLASGKKVMTLDKLNYVNIYAWEIICKQWISTLWSGSEIIIINKRWTAYGHWEKPKLNKSFYKKTISKIWYGSEIIKMNWHIGLHMYIGYDAKLCNGQKKMSRLWSGSEIIN